MPLAVKRMASLLLAKLSSMRRWKTASFSMTITNLKKNHQISDIPFDRPHDCNKIKQQLEGQGAKRRATGAILNLFISMRPMILLLGT
jgi:hypothetical protein